MARVVQFNTDMLRDGYTISAAMVYGYLRWNCKHAKWRGPIHTSLGLMAKTLCITRRSIINGIHQLEKNYLIDIERADHQMSDYYIVDKDRYVPCANYDGS